MGKLAQHVPACLAPASQLITFTPNLKRRKGQQAKFRLGVSLLKSLELINLA